jgi:uncharacterized repeat protein (TIGR02543 family)
MIEGMTEKSNRLLNISMVLLALLFLTIFVAPVAAAPAPPTFVSAATNTAGTVITITFSEAMARPGLRAAHEFTYSINGGHARPFRAIALSSGSNTMIDLTISGTPIAYGETVTINYAAGTVRARNGGILASFSNGPVTNNVPAPGTPISYTVTYDSNGVTDGTVPIDSNTYVTGASVTVLGNTGDLVWEGGGDHTFNGWNTSPDGSGVSYSPGATFTMGSADVTLYAQWAILVFPS